MDQKLIIGTRGSPLALAQAHETKDRLMAAHGWPADRLELAVIKTSGDLILDRPLAEVGGKGLFTRELDEALLDGRIHLAVHSMKDVPTHIASGTMLAAVLPREDYRDRLIAPGGRKLKDLPRGARIGTSSLRRAAQLSIARPDVRIIPFRGNVGTRLARLEAGEADATLLAAAGLNRLGHGDLGDPLPIGVMLPAVAQGAIGITCRSDDPRVLGCLAALNDIETADAIAIERAFLAELDGSCRTPIAALARFRDDGDVELRGELLSVDGTRHVKDQIITDISGAQDAAQAMAQRLRAQTTPDWFAA
jgi:hydroxymethylbilane synthase